MTILQGILLGCLQGIAEFLPISSSGHLAVAQNLFGLGEVPLLFDVFLHLATLFAVCIYFRKKIWSLLKILGRWISHRPRKEAEVYDDLLCGTDVAGRKTIIAIIITTAITGIIGIITSKLIPELSIKVTCAGFIVTSILLILSAVVEKKTSNSNDRLLRFARNDENNNNNTCETKNSHNELVSASLSSTNDEAQVPKGISIFQSIIIGLMQGLGTLPGISRSASTIAGALFSKVDRKSAGDYSFIVSIPAILGAFILELKDLGEVSSSIGFWPVFLGCISAFVVGYFSLVVLMKLIRKGKLAFFACYLIPLGILGMIFLK